MPELFLELFSEEIPARMQARAAEDLARLVGEALATLKPAAIRTFHGPRRIALAAEIAARVAGSSSIERGPRSNAPEQALAGFLRKHNATKDQLRVEGDYWALDKTSAAIGAAELIAVAMPTLLRRFPWPKSMRWGGTSNFAWVRPLRRIVCLLDREIVRFDLRDGEDDGHGLASADVTEGHRFLSQGAFPVTSCADWEQKLRAQYVLVDAAERQRVIVDRIAALAAEKSLTVADDPGLLDEVSGLVEWPVPLLGRIDDAYMDLPPEVMQVSMRVNLRYFALRTADGEAAPFFAFAANIEATDGGAAIIAGNERVLRARFADARHFWDLDRRTKLADRVPALDAITFHAKLGSQGDRVRRIELLAREIAPLVGADPVQAKRAAHLAKADLVTGMVGEFPELQGVMGRYYALHDREPREVADAIRDHYSPKGPTDAVPHARVSVAVALADKFDLLAGFFAIGEKPTGSGDPYALRRAALGVIRTIRENTLYIDLLPLIKAAAEKLPQQVSNPANSQGVLNFITERLRVQLRSEGARHDIVAAVFAARPTGKVVDDLLELLQRSDAIAKMLESPEGENLLTGYRRAGNILFKEEARDKQNYYGDVDATLLELPEEIGLHLAVEGIQYEIFQALEERDYESALLALAGLRVPLDRFFDAVTVNVDEPRLRANRLRLLSQVRDAMETVAEFSMLES